MTVDSFASLFGPRRIMVILRGLPPTETVRLAHTAWDAGVELLEVPIGKPEQVHALFAAVAAGAERGKLVGAGTVISRSQVDSAAAAGARYTVAPGFDPAVLASSLAAGMPHLPGVASATDIQAALAAGCQWVKAFPASTLGTGWFKAMRGPFADLNLVATGGITVATAPQYLAAGAAVVALGSALSDPEQVEKLSALIAESDFPPA